MNVWIGFSEGEPDQAGHFNYEDAHGFPIKAYSVFLRKADALRCYEDVRPAVLTFQEQEKP